eukprot:jgi/Astpho2/8787/Aster-05342
MVRPRTSVAEAATTVFDDVDAFPYSAVQQSDVTLVSAGLMQNLSSYVVSNTSNSSGTVTSGNFAVLVAVRVIVNTTAYATTVNSSSYRRRELLVQAEADTAFTLAATHTKKLVSVAAAAGRPQRRQLQADTSTTVSALQLKLHLLTSAFQGVSTCNATAITSLYYDGVAPLFLAASCSADNNSAQSSSNLAALNAYLLQAASVASNQLLPYQATEQSMRLSLVSLQVQLQQLQAATLLAALAAQSGTPCARIDGEGQYYFQVNHGTSANTSATATQSAETAVPWLERLWYGYDVYSTRDLNPAETVTEQYRERFLGSKGSNRLLTGLFLQQERFVLKCQGHFGRLGSACQDQQFAYLSQWATANSPFGYDPVFGTYSSLWNIQLVGQEGSFYNLTTGSGEADFSGNPFGFMDEKMPGAIVDFPALFTTEMSANRSADVLQYLLDGKYLANGVQQMQLRMVAYNGNARLFGYFALRLTWNRDGSITSSVSFAALQVVPYSAANAEWRPIITDAFLVVLAACFTAFTVIKVQSAQRDVGGSLWKALKEHPQLGNDWAICVAQWTGLALYVTFAVRQCTNLQPQPYYEVYDSDEYAQARFFLLNHPTGHARHLMVTNTITTSTEQGGPDRWELPRNTTGFQQYLQFAEAINILYELHSWFIFFQTSILVQLVIRWLQQW